MRRRRTESLHTTLAYAFSDDTDRIYRLDMRGGCNCEGHRPMRGCKHSDAFSEALEASTRGVWRSDVQFVVTPWGAEDLGLTHVDGLDVRPTP